MIGIVCCTRNGVIGAEGKIPWFHPSDSKLFTKITKAHKRSLLLCGTKTYKTLHKSLLTDKIRKVIIITNENINTIDQIIKPYRKVFVIGGSWLYDKLKDKIQQYIITMLCDDIPGDKFIDLNYIRNNFEFVMGDTISAGIISQYKRKPSNESLYFKMILQISSLGCNYKGYTKGDRTIGLNGITTCYNLSDNKLPVLSSKYIFLKGIVKELLWFIRGETDVSILNKDNVKFWNMNTNRSTLDKLQLEYRKEYDAGPIYGFNFRYFGAKYIDCDTDYKGSGVDQLTDVINRIRKDVKLGKTSRRNIISLWNPSQLSEVVLPPCHVLYQYVLNDNKTLSCIMYQRSGDLGLGIPFNIVSASLLLNIICAMTNTIPYELIHVIAHAHIYKDHLQSLLKQYYSYNINPKLSEVTVKICGLDNTSTVDDISEKNIDISSYKYYKTDKLNMINTSI